MKNLSYLFFAYSLVWIFLFGYIFSLSRKQSRIVKEIRMLKEVIQKGKE